VTVTLEEFRESLAGDVPSLELDRALAGLWWDAKGDWNKAHDSAQEDEGPAGSWVHAYLHRKEGDESNAGYWYRRAGRTPSRATLQEEWTEIVNALLSD
jgi:hypothetical protein